MPKTARRSFQTITGISVAGFIALIAMNGKAFVDAVAALPTVLSNFAQVLPLGTASFLLVGACAGFSWLAASRSKFGKDFAAESVSLAVAIAFMVALSLTSPVPKGETRAGELLQAIMLGMLAGFAAPYFFKGVIAGMKWFNREIDDAPPEDKP